MEEIEFNTLYISNTNKPEGRHYFVFWKNVIGASNVTEWANIPEWPDSCDSSLLSERNLEEIAVKIPKWYRKANLKEYMDWTKLYNDGSLKFDVRELDPLAKLPEDSLKMVKDYSGLFE